MQKVLVIDDDHEVLDTLGIMLEKEGFEPVLTGDGQTGIEQALALQPEIILLDLTMPGLGGADVCKRIRSHGMKTPLIVLSAADDELNKVKLLDIGADDYMVKPFRVRELLARIRAILRRAAPEETAVAEFGEVHVDFTRRAVTKRGQEMSLTRGEYNLLTYFLQNPDRALTREVILNSVWGYNSVPQTRTVDAHVVRLRQKLEPEAGHPRHFLTVHGVGYRFIP